MVGKVISDYIEGGARKLTVPGFGTFMRKDGGAVIFVDLLRSDDGVLRELVEDYGQYSEVDAMALIDRFIFEIKNGITRQGRAVIDGFGVMTLDHRGLYQFDYSPKKRPVKETAVQENLFGSGLEPEQKPHKPVKSQSIAPKRIPVNRRPKPGNRTKSVKSMRETRNGASDLFIIVAIVAAAIAIIAMVFGLSTGNMPFMER